MTGRRLPRWAFYAIAALVVLLDQAVKVWVQNRLSVGSSFVLWDGVFQILHTQNRGMAFSLLERTPYAQLILVGAAVIVVSGIVIAERRIGKHLSPILGVALALPLGGAVGNLLDRVRQGYVTDLFDFRLINFPVFNVADAAITIGVVLLLWHNLTMKEPQPEAVNEEMPTGISVESPVRN